jgi:ubiquinone/menaquinone biosynthesis C-methylase UbiE
MNDQHNIDIETVEGFGDEWERFDQSTLPPEEHQRLFDLYFNIFPWESLPDKAVGFDLGCGSGRWAALVAPRVHQLHCIDPSSALDVAKQNLADTDNCFFHQTGVDQIPLDDNCMDFGYSLGVLHHVPDTQAALNACVSKIRPGAPFLIYLYYSFDNKPQWFRLVWRISDVLRIVVSKLPYGLRYAISQIFALLVYWPMARASRILERLGINVETIPLSAYRDLSFYTMRTDALDRFGTRLEKRFSKIDIEQMMTKSGLNNIRFSENVPYWCAVGTKQE